MPIRLSALHLYPVKSLGGLSVAAWKAGKLGLEHDRQWMLVDAEGQFLSQRRYPRMALIHTRLSAHALTLSAAGMADLTLPLHPVDGAAVMVRVWEDRLSARAVDAAADDWLNRFLGADVRLVRFAPDSERTLDPEYARPEDRTGFADGFPFLLISEASLEELNGRLAEPLSMSRFRPNLVVSGCAPFAEDGWTRIRIGELEFRVVKPCSRCAITTVDPLSAEQGVEPLRTLAGYRRRNGKVYFGQNLIHDGLGALQCGDPVTVLEAG